MTTVLVTGGAGFIGSHVAKHCLGLGFKVVVLDNLTGGYRENIPEGVITWYGDILDEKLIQDLFTEYKFDYVYHLAAYAAEGLSHFIRKYNYENNVIGSMNIINACVNHEVKCLVFTSSIAVMAGAIPPYSEAEALRPIDPYGHAKALVEQDLHSALQMFGLNYIVFRPHNVFGPGQNIGDKYRNVIGIFMNQIMQGKPLTIFGDGGQTRAFSYIDDVAPHIAMSVSKPECYNQVFNIGGEIPYSVFELANMIGEEFGVKPEIKHLQARHEAYHAHSDHEKARHYFGAAKTQIRDGIKKMAEWAKLVGARETSEFTQIEIRKNLPEGW